MNKLANEQTAKRQNRHHATFYFEKRSIESYRNCAESFCSLRQSASRFQCRSKLSGWY